MKWLIAVALLMLASCGSEGVSPDSPTCMPPIDTDIAPEPMGTPPVWVDRGVPFQRPPGRQFNVQTWLPQTYNRGSVYPIVQGDSAHVRFRFMVGLEYDSIASRTFILVEGRPVEVVVDGNRVSRVELDAPMGLSEVTLQIPSDQLQPGLNQVNPVTFFELRHEGRSFIKVGAGTVFSIANGSSTPQVYEESVGLEAGEFESRGTTRVYRTLASHLDYGEIPFPVHNRFLGALDDPTDVRIRIQASTQFAQCPDAVERQLIVAFRDGEPVAMGDRDRIMVSVEPEQQLVHRFSLPAWSEDGLNHHYTILMLAGFGRPGRTSRGGVAPWAGVLPNICDVQWLVPSGT